MQVLHLRYKLFLLTLSTLIVAFINAQSNFELKKFKQYTTSNGLSHNNVSTIVQDKLGFLWIGTANGLNRFDGYNFINYTNTKADKTSLSNNYITSLCVDSKGFIWAATQNGLNKYDTKAETFTQYLPIPNSSNSISSNELSYVYEDKGGNIWIGADKTLDCYNPKTGTFKHYTPPKSIATENCKIEGIIEYNNELFFSVWGVGIFKINASNNLITQVPINNQPYNAKNWVHDFYINTQNELIAVDGMLLQYKKEDNTFHRIPSNGYKHELVSLDCIAQLNNNTYLAGTNGVGFKVYDSKLQYLHTYLLDKDTSLLFNNFNQALLITKTGEIWFGTVGNGLFLYDANYKKFESFEYQSNELNSINRGAITGVYCTPQNKILISSRDDEASIYNKATNTFKRLKANTNGLNSPYAKPILQDKQGNIWIGTWGGGLNRIDAVTGKYTYFLYPQKSTPTTLPDNFVTNIKQSNDGKIWVATCKGIALLETQFGTTKVKNLNHLSNIKKEIIEARSDILFCGSDDNVWIGTDAFGLIKYNTTANTFAYYNYDFNNPNSIGSNKINYIYEDSKKRIWIGCGSGGGLNLLIPTTNTFIQYTTKDGLPSNQINGIVEDNKGDLWVTTDKGLSYFDTQSKLFKNYNTDDGLLSNQFYPQVICKSPVDGKIYAGTTAGLVSFMPDSIINNKALPAVFITSFKIYTTQNNKTTTSFLKGIEQLTQVTLNYTQNTVTINLLALNYNNSNKNLYAYKLEGLNNSWVALGSTREITFSNLSPGTYTLYVKASNSDGVWNEKGTSLQIKILPPWYTTWWAYMLYTLGAIALIFAFMRYRINTGIKKLKEQQALRTKISSDLHDDVGTILSGLAMQSQMLTYTAKEEQKKSLLEISSMSRDAMERMRDTVWAMDSRKDKVENLVDRMRDFAEKNLALKNIEHQFKITNVETKKIISPEKRQAIYLIFKEAITNIVKHSNGNKVTITFTEEKNKTILVVKDNGSKKEKSNSDGLGMGNMKMRAEKIGGAFNTKYDNGFTVELEI